MWIYRKSQLGTQPQRKKINLMTNPIGISATPTISMLDWTDLLEQAGDIAATGIYLGAQRIQGERYRQLMTR